MCLNTMLGPYPPPTSIQTSALKMSPNHESMNNSGSPPTTATTQASQYYSGQNGYHSHYASLLRRDMPSYDHGEFLKNPDFNENSTISLLIEIWI